MCGGRALTGGRQDYTALIGLFYKFRVSAEDNEGLGNSGLHLENERGVKIPRFHL